MRELGRQAARSSAWVIGNNILAGLASFFAQIWFARVLGVAEIGRYAVVIVAIDLTLGLMDFGFNRAVIRGRNIPKLFNGALALILFQSVAFFVSAGVIFALHYLLGFEGTYFYLVGTILIVGRALGLFASLGWSPVEADLQYRALSTARSIAALVAIGSAIAFVLAGAGIAGLAVRDIVYPLVLLVALRLYCWRRFVPNFARDAIMPVWGFSRGVWTLNVLERSAIRLDYALVGSALGVEILGIYFQVRALMEGVLSFIATPIQTVLYAFYCRTQVLLETARRNVLRWAAAVSIGALLSIAIILVPFGEKLLTSVLGSEWAEGANLLGGFAVYFWAMIYFENLKSLAMAQALHAKAMWGRVAQILIVGVFMVPLIKLMGLAGAGLVAGLAAIALVVTATITVFRTKEPIVA